MKGFRVRLSTRVDGVRDAIAAFGPVVAGRGVYQLSAYVDTILASLLAAGALASLRPALMLYILPVSLFGLSVAASELPELSRLRTADLSPFLRRLRRSVRQTLFLTVPTMMGYLAFGFLIVGALFRRGEFGVGDNLLVYAVLGGYALGLVATTISRLLQNAFYAIQDTKTPAQIAVVRLVVSAAVAVPLMIPLDTVAVSALPWMPDPADPTYLGAVGLAVGASAGAWVELGSLLRALRIRLETPLHLPWRRIAQMVGLALAAAALGAGLWWMLPPWPVVATAAVVVGAYAAIYLGGAALAGFDELDAWTGRLLQRVRS
jgi:putative peptidoglycan lipid II flippase